MKLIRFSLLVLLLVAGALIVFDSPGSAEREQGSDASGAASGGGPQAEETEEDQAEPVETFVPTERLPADSAISFPVDI
jgi:hypothetical protein